MYHLNSHSHTTGIKPSVYITFMKKQRICSVLAKYSLWHKYCQIAKVFRSCRSYINTNWDFKGDDVGQMPKTQLASILNYLCSMGPRAFKDPVEKSFLSVHAAVQTTSVPGQNLQHQTGAVERKIYKINAEKICAEFRPISTDSVTC